MSNRDVVLHKHTCGRCEIVSRRYDLAFVSINFLFYYFFLIYIFLPVCFFFVTHFKDSPILSKFFCHKCVQQMATYFVLHKHTCGRCEVVYGRYDLAYVSSSFLITHRIYTTIISVHIGWSLYVFASRIC